MTRTILLRRPLIKSSAISLAVLFYDMACSAECLNILPVVGTYIEVKTIYAVWLGPPAFSLRHVHLQMFHAVHLLNLDSFCIISQIERLSQDAVAEELFSERLTRILSRTFMDLMGKFSAFPCVKANNKSHVQTGYFFSSPEISRVLQSCPPISTSQKSN